MRIRGPLKTTASFQRTGGRTGDRVHCKPNARKVTHLNTSPALGPRRSSHGIRVKALGSSQLCLL